MDDRYYTAPAGGFITSFDCFFFANENRHFIMNVHPLFLAVLLPHFEQNENLEKCCTLHHSKQIGAATETI